MRLARKQSSGSLVAGKAIAGLLSSGEGVASVLHAVHMGDEDEAVGVCVEIQNLMDSSVSLEEKALGCC